MCTFKKVSEWIKYVDECGKIVRDTAGNWNITRTEFWYLGHMFEPANGTPGYIYVTDGKKGWLIPESECQFVDNDYYEDGKGYQGVIASDKALLCAGFFD